MSVYPTPIPSLASPIRALLLDVDGVLTDGRLRYGPEGEQLKAFHSRDGLGLKMLMSRGVQVGVITARRSKMVELRTSQLGIGHLMMGKEDKATALRAMAEKLGLPLEAMAFMGDDVLDLPAMSLCGLALTVADAHPLVKERADWISRLPGGGGAVREACDALLCVDGELALLVERYLETLSAT